MDNHFKVLQNNMQLHEIDVWLQPVADEFQGEYPAAYAKRLHKITGFSGSAGFCAFVNNSGKHALFVDGRYTIQAEQEVDTQQIEVMPAYMALEEWLKSLKKHSGEPIIIGFDGWLHSYQQILQWRQNISDELAVFKAITPNIIDEIWQDQPPMPIAAVHLHAMEYAGQSAEEKIAKLHDNVRQQGADACLLTLPDSICWLLNIRGSDVECNPLLLSYALIKTSGEIVLYTSFRNFEEEVLVYFKKLNISLQPIESVFQGQANPFNGVKKMLLAPQSAPYILWEMAAQVSCDIIAGKEPVQLAKSCKNNAEITGMKQAHVRDAAAICQFLAELSDQEKVSEFWVDERLTYYRSRQNGYKGPSFATIAGSGAHGAIVHYRANEASNRIWQNGELLLIDSGGQYVDGTTDITRTLVKGAASLEMKDRYTRVLKGHISLARAVFPVGTTGAQLDVLARQYLWEIGCDYDHGTGHGVGAHLCVHEGPQSIGKRGQDVALMPGMILSNEPGYYKKDAYGIRIENLVLVVPRGKSVDGREMLGFETITLVPIATNLIEKGLMRPEEIQWLNDYHAQILGEISTLVDDKTRQWLNVACAVFE